MTIVVTGYIMAHCIWTILSRIYRFNYGLLSCRIKRVCFWGTVYGYQCVNVPKVDSLIRLNDKMKLSGDAVALGYPAIVKRFVLHDNGFLDAVKALTDTQCPQTFYDRLPAKWKYGNSDGFIIDDAIKYLEFCQQRKTVTA